MFVYDRIKWSVIGIANAEAWSNSYESNLCFWQMLSFGFPFLWVSVEEMWLHCVCDRITTILHETIGDIYAN